ncbi:MAG: methyltransferase domain-containing protein [Fimbriimonadales bacterium]
MANDWSAYYEATLDKPLHPVYAELEPHLPAGGVALELGCGVGHGVRHLLEKGFHVVAIDGEPEAIEIVRSRLPEDADVEMVVANFETVDLPACDVAVAGFSLFFLEPPAFDKFWRRLVAAIRPGGLFAGQFLGPNDDWVSRGYSVHSRAQIDELFRDFEVLHLEEAERDGETAMKTPKHWHVFHVVARKR